jgi:hypothetical protein
MNNYKDFLRIVGIFIACAITVLVVKSMLNSPEFSEASLAKYKFKITSHYLSKSPKIFDLTFDSNQKTSSNNKDLNGLSWKLINDKHIQIGDCHLKGGDFPHELYGNFQLEWESLPLKLEYNGVKKG